MTVTDLLSHLRSIGVMLTIDADGKLAFDAPADVTTDELLAKMRSHRDELCALVEQERAAIVQFAGGPSQVEPVVVEAAYLAPMCGLMCPWCRSDGHLVEHDSGLLCDNCGCEAWRFDDGAVVRCDWIKASVTESPIVPSGGRDTQPDRYKPTTIERDERRQTELMFQL